MDAWVLHGKKDIRLEKRPVPVVNKDEVLIKVKRVGICGSDMSYYRTGKVGQYIPSQPFVFGHEFSGDIAELGSAVKDLKVDDRVAVDPSLSCGECEFCRSGRSNLCRNMKYLGSAMYVPPVDGAFREYIAMPVRNCYRLPDKVSYETGALLEPMSVAFYALRRAGEIKRKSVLITGGGTIGQLILSFAVALGAEKVYVSEPVQSKRYFAAERGAYQVLDPLSKDFHDKANEIMQDGFDFVIEASGSVSALRQGLHLVKAGGTVVQVGILPPEELIPVGLILFKELDYIGSFRFCGVYQNVLAMYDSVDVKAEALISHTFSFKELEKAIQYADEAGDLLKVQVEL